MILFPKERVPPVVRRRTTAPSTSSAALPCVRWTLTSPNGTVYANNNPSSQREWEQFLVSSEPGCDASPTCDPSISNCADYCESGLLPSGVWHVQVVGVDMSNLNAWRSDNLNSFCLNCDVMPRPYLVGDTVFADLNQTVSRIRTSPASAACSWSWWTPTAR